MSEQLTLVLCGSINSGKSSIINALLGKVVADTSAKGGETINVSGFNLNRDFLVESNDLQLHIVDVPGISEVGGQDHAHLAFQAAKKGDLILFAVSGDLTQSEFSAVKAMHELNKPIIVLFNQIDRYTSVQREEILKNLRSTLKDYVGGSNILQIAAAPIRRILVVQADGKEVLEDRSGLPDIDALKKRIIKLAQQEGKQLKELNDLITLHEVQQKELDTNLKSLRTEAIQKVENFAVFTGLAIGANPIPLADLVGGVASISVMLNDLVDLYEVEMEDGEVTRLGGELWEEGSSLLAGVLAANIGGSLLKSIPFIGTIIGGIVQGGPAGYFVYVLGVASIEYFENDKCWNNNRSMHTALEDIISSVDKDAITAKISARIKQKLTA